MSFQQTSEYIIHENGTRNDLLSLLYDHLEKSINHCVLEERLELIEISCIAHQLATLYKSDIMLNPNDEELIKKIIGVINVRLMKNPAFIFFLHDLNASLEGRYRLSDNKIAAAIKNSAFLVSIDELWQLAQLMKTIQNTTGTGLSRRRLCALLKAFDVGMHKTILQLWDSKISLISGYHFSEFRAQEENERKKYANKKRKVQRDFNALIAALGVTEEYANQLRNLIFDRHEDKMYELFEDAYSGEKETLSLAAYAMNIAKNQREKVAFYNS